jgi:hypothetical protein
MTPRPRKKNYLFWDGGPGERSRYSESLRAGRSGDRIPVGARFFVPVQTGPGVHPTSCAMGNGSFSGVKRPVRGVVHPSPFSAEVKESRAMSVLHLWAFVACFRVNCNLYLIWDRGWQSLRNSAIFSELMTASRTTCALSRASKFCTVAHNICGS